MAFLECKTSVCTEFRNTSWNNFHLICWILFNPYCLECTNHFMFLDFPVIFRYSELCWNIFVLSKRCFGVSNLVYGKTEKIWNVFACIKWHILGLLSQCSVKLPCLFYYLFMISLDLWNVENYIFDFIFVYMIKVWLYSGVLVIGIILPDLLQPSNAM